MGLGGFFEQILVLYAIGSLGFFARKKGVLNEHSNEILTQLVLCLTLPFLILYSMDQPYNVSVAKDLFWLVIMSVFILTVSCVIAGLMGRHSKLPDTQKSVYKGVFVTTIVSLVTLPALYWLFTIIY